MWQIRHRGRCNFLEKTRTVRLDFSAPKLVQNRLMLFKALRRPKCKHLLALGWYLVPVCNGDKNLHVALLVTPKK